MNQGARSAALLLAVISFAGTLGGCSQSFEVATVSSEQEANHILVALDAQAGIASAEKKLQKTGQSQSWVIRVPSHRRHDALWLLDQLHLPRAEPPKIEDLITGTRTLQSRKLIRAQLAYATDARLQQMLETVDRVISASVHITVPEEDTRRSRHDDPVVPKASVLVKVLPGCLGDDVESAMTATTAIHATKEDTEEPDERLAFGGEDDTQIQPADQYGRANAPLTPQMVKDMVAGAVDGLEVENVSVIFTTAESLQFIDKATRATLEKNDSAVLDATRLTRLLACVAGGFWLLMTVFVVLWWNARRALNAVHGALEAA